MKKSIRPILAPLLLWAAATISSGSCADAHEFIIKPARLQAQPGAKVPFAVLAAHVFMVSDEMEPVRTVQVWLLEGDKKSLLSLNENKGNRTLDGVATLSRKGTAVLIGHLREPIESAAATGAKPAQRIKREKFSKALITVASNDESYKKVLGHKLEIVPASDITKAKPGDELAFRVLFDGKPLAAQVYATYDGFSRRHNTYAYVTETADGTAYVRVSRPGTWMVRVEKRVEETAKDYDLHALKATLIFSVK
jgi:uncharacterized GH25 family protein